MIEEVIYQYVLKTLQRDRELLDNHHTDRFRILGLEKKIYWTFGGFPFKGFIDRMDNIGGVTRIVDYKTGRVTDNEILIDDTNAAAVSSALFGDKNDKRPKIALQMYLYDYAVAGDGPYDALANAVYSVSGLFSALPPQAPVCADFCSLMKGRLLELLDEITDLSKPIPRTTDVSTCDYCDFKKICGR